MSAGGMLQTLVWAILVIVVIIVIFLVAERLITHLTIAPIAYADTEDKQKVVDKFTTSDNDTKITVTCTSNIPDLVYCD